MGTNRKSALQKQINSDWQWKEMLERQGLTVVDIYTEWCGPCVAMKSTLRKLQRELVEHNFQLAIDGKIVNVMYGANAPKLMRLITAELKKEAAVKAGTRERVELEITNFPGEENVHVEIVEEAAEVKEMPNVMVEEEEFTYRPF